jgi:hypothetical protein
MRFESKTDLALQVPFSTAKYELLAKWEKYFSIANSTMSMGCSPNGQLDAICLVNAIAIRHHSGQTNANPLDRRKSPDPISNPDHNQAV